MFAGNMTGFVFFLEEIAKARVVRRAGLVKLPPLHGEIVLLRVWKVRYYFLTSFHLSLFPMYFDCKASSLPGMGSDVSMSVNGALKAVDWQIIADMKRSSALIFILLNCEAYEAQLSFSLFSEQTHSLLSSFNIKLGWWHPLTLFYMYDCLWRIGPPCSLIQSILNVKM